MGGRDTGTICSSSIRSNFGAKLNAYPAHKFDFLYVHECQCEDGFRDTPTHISTDAHTAAAPVGVRLCLTHVGALDVSRRPFRIAVR